MTFDPIALIESAYRHHDDSAAWLQATTQNVVEAIDPTCLAAMSYVLGSRGPEHPVTVIAKGQLDLHEVTQMVTMGWTMATAEDTRKVAIACRKPGINSLRHILSDAPIDRWLERCRDWPVAIADAVAVLLPGPEGKPILLSMACARPRRIHASEQVLWHRIAIHLSAGWRLAGRPPGTNAGDVEAVVTAEGRVAHATGVCATAEGRELLRHATRDIDRARSQTGRSDPLAALDLWHGLLAGRWSLVEHFDTDGRRFMLARRNEPRIPDPPALTRRQRQVVFYVSLGLSNKETGYALGLAENTVSAHLAAGLARLRINRAELVHTSAALATEALLALAPR